MKRLRVANKLRFYTFITFTLFLFFFLVSFTSQVYSSIHKIEFTEIKVIEGDTLWDIARKYTPPKGDIRKTIFNIKEFNDIDTSFIYPGEIIKVPILNK